MLVTARKAAFVIMLAVTLWAGRQGVFASEFTPFQQYISFYGCWWDFADPMGFTAFCTQDCEENFWFDFDTADACDWFCQTYYTDGSMVSAGGFECLGTCECDGEPLPVD
jgi:hypothetical protein